MYKALLTMGLGLLLIGCQTEASQPAMPQAAEPEVEYLNPPGAEGRPFTEAVRVGNMLYLSGKIGSVPGQGLVEGGIQPETRQVMENIKDALERYGSSMNRVVNCTVFLADIAEPQLARFHIEAPAPRIAQAPGEYFGTICGTKPLCAGTGGIREKRVACGN